MTEFGFSLMCELHDPLALVEQAKRAEQAGFDFVTISDHFHPWLYSHGHSPYAWSVLGALAATTERVRLVSLVTCPTVRYHPAIVAQKAATVQFMSNGRFELGVGAGENLNEHVVGRGWPPASVRHEMLTEAIQVIRELWTGKMVDHRGDHFTVEDARIYTLPERPPPIHVAASGERSIRLAAEHGDGLIAIDPDEQLTQRYDELAGGGKPKYGQLGVSVYDDKAEALQTAHAQFRFTAPGWKVMSELPNPVNFEAATESVREDDIAEAVPCGPDAAPIIQTTREWIDAGFDQLCFVQVGDNQENFFRLWERELAPALRN